MFDIVAEAPEHAEAIETLYDLSFGPGRYAKTAYRLREDVLPIAELCFVAFCGTGPDTKMMGSVRFSPLQIGDVPGLLLGPLAMDPSVRGQGGGLALMEKGLNAARAAGHKLVILVGDAPYYAKAGFKQVPIGQLSLPGPVDRSRLLYCELEPGAFEGVSGAVTKPAS